MKPTLKILILDNTREPGSFGSPDLLHWAVRSAPVGSEVMMRRAPDQDLDFSIKPDALILSGSVTSCLPPYESWVSEYDRYVTEQIQKKTPILGICFGHQTLARCLFKREGLTPALAKAKDAEHGWEKVRVVGKSTLFEGLEEGFFTSHSHYEEITEVPPGSRRVGESDRCQIQAFEMKDAPVFGIQFHPEHEVEKVESSLKKKLEQGLRRDWVLNAGRGKDLYHEKVGKTIFGNFFKIAQSH